jgi:Xaa-Pro aminopeptidase
VTGFLVSLYTRPVLLLLERGEPPRLIIPTVERPIAERLPWGGAVLDYAGDAGAAASLVAEVLAERKPRSMAADVQAMPAALLDRLRSGLPGTSIQDASEPIESLWWTKGPAELEAIRHAGALCATAVGRAREAIAAGESELAAKAEGDRAVLTGAAQRHPDERVHLFSNVITGSRTTAGGGHDLPTGRRPRQGDLVFYLWAVNCEGCWALMTRSTFMGDPGSDVREIARRVEQAKGAALGRLRAGAAAAAVFEAAASAMGQHPAMRTISVGRGIGAQMGETPAIAADSAVPLRAGMVLRLGPEVFGPFGAIGMIDTVAVTDQGYEVLTAA